jgi:RHS repeat-associated protein
MRPKTHPERTTVSYVAARASRDRRMYPQYCRRRSCRCQSGSGGTLATFKYDALGRRIEYNDAGNGTVKRYCYDGQQCIAEYEADPDPGNPDPPPPPENCGGWGGGDAPQAPQAPGGSTSVNPFYFTGQRLDRIGGTRQIYDYRARSYDAWHGRFLQRDPAQYRDSMGLYEYVLSRPTYFVDPEGQGARELGLAQAAINAIHNTHCGRYYYERDMWLTGLRPLLFDQLWWALHQIGAGGVEYGNTGDASAKYVPSTWTWAGTFLLDKTKRGAAPREAEVFHELIHAYDDLTQPRKRTTSEYNSDEEFEERLAYAAQYIMERLNDFKRFDDEIRTKDAPDDDTLIRRWGAAWEALSRAMEEQAYLPSHAKYVLLTPGDYKRVYSKLGLRIRCNMFAKAYNELAEKKGSCVRFLCYPRPSSAKPGTGVKPAHLKKSLDRVFISEYND